MYNSLLIAIVVILALIFLLRLYSTLSHKKMTHKSLDKLSKDLSNIDNVDKETKVVESLNNQLFELALEIEDMKKQFKEGSKMAQTRNKAISDKLEDIERILFAENQEYEMIVGIRKLRKDILDIIENTVYCEEGLNKVREKNQAIKEKEQFEAIAHKDIQKLSKSIKQMERDIQNRCGKNPF